MKGYDVIISKGVASWRQFYFAVGVQDAWMQAARDYPGAEIQAVVSHHMILA